MLPELRLGRVEEARAHHQQGYRLVRSGRRFVFRQADHVRFLVLVGDLDEARSLVERHIPDALETIEPLDRFEFLLASSLWGEGLLRAGTRSVRIRLPEAAPPAADRGYRDVQACRDWFLHQARDLAGQFDRRNGTDAFRRRIDELPELLRLGRGTKARLARIARPADRLAIDCRSEIMESCADRTRSARELKGYSGCIMPTKDEEVVGLATKHHQTETGMTQILRIFGSADTEVNRST